jgi:hypothetical protein
MVLWLASKMSDPRSHPTLPDDKATILATGGIAFEEDQPPAGAADGCAQNIIWIASYPKSGNTWVRVFLHNLRRELSDDAESVQDISSRRFRMVTVPARCPAGVRARQLMAASSQVSGMLTGERNSHGSEHLIPSFEGRAGSLCFKCRD